MYEKQVTIRINKKLHKLLEKRAKEQMRSASGLIRLILTKDLEASRFNECIKKHCRTRPYNSWKVMGLKYAVSY